jgi:hypothetical protein
MWLGWGKELRAPLERPEARRNGTIKIVRGLAVFAFCLLCRGETWVWTKKGENRIRTTEKRFLRSVKCRIRLDRGRQEIIRVWTYL